MKMDKNRIEIIKEHHRDIDIYAVKVVIGNWFEGIKSGIDKSFAVRCANAVKKETGFNIYDLTDKCHIFLCEGCGYDPYEFNWR